MELQHAGVKCTVKRKDKSTYESLYFGTFQYRDENGERPVAVVKLHKGNLGFVSLSAVFFDPAPYMTDKNGTRIYFEE